ncbi:phosphatidylinositol 3,4,5-trisphosphate 5-phosphatase 2B-like isoform X2 [Myxocyprinus asiaticus]|uniref:phosphatidylinositol 3,4,5-trisphosphate 5-phosphatase 2B-like isoform X2 n=1 Tax=Myxocyprinus asiaticus TaxID=70543 RepID=UPI002222E4E3|nr:phosphatidylinositol 3,4,5-trisphosphate 5-phosphatase 2B-like isoform X2 [Myxocyprinus asiaticus]
MVGLVLFTSWTEQGRQREERERESWHNISSNLDQPPRYTSFACILDIRVLGRTMTTASWYHRDISRVQAEELLACAGRDGSFLVRDSESVPGAYALCLLFQRHVHTYRILPDADGLLAVQATQGVQVNCFRTLGDLVAGYQHPHKGLVAPLIFPVVRETEPNDESSDGDDEKPGSTFASPPQAMSRTGHPPPSSSAASHLLLQRLQDLSPTSVGCEIIPLLNEYLHDNMCIDLENVKRGASGLQHFQCILSRACDSLHSEIDQTLSSLETLAKVFDYPSGHLTFSTMQNTGKSPEENMDNLLHKLTTLYNLLSSLEKRVLKALQEAVTSQNLSLRPVTPPEAVTATKKQARPNPVHSFQVKVVRYGRQIVSVDIDAGVLLFDKKAGSFGMETVTHDRVVQLVKFQRGPAKLKIVVDSHHNPARELVFESIKKREAFCRLLQLMKAAHSQQSELDIISVFVGTWNMGGTPPPSSLQSWVTCCGLGLTPDESICSVPHDIYAVGTQDNPQGEREWAEHIKATLRNATNIDFKQVAVQSLWNIRLAVFVKPEHEGRITQVNTASVKTGLGNTLGNKGAVGVSLLFNGTSMGFVNCHLTSGSDKALRRNHNFQDILRLLSLGEKQLSTFDISLRFNHLFWCGDLNYRLDLDALDILKHVSKREFEELMSADQLARERHRRKAFFNFKEEKILFPPTYRYERGSRDCYLWQKYKSSRVQVNGPSWCDRVLWKSYPESHITCTSYGCTDDIFTSDHSPVFATFEVGVISQFPRTDSGSERASIELKAIEAIVKTASKAKFFIEVHSRCLEEPRRSAENDSQCCAVSGFLKLGWSSKQFPKLHPVSSDLEHLQDQHLLFSVKSCDGFESYGECCVALRWVTGNFSESFGTCLTHRGEEMGSIRGRIRVFVPPDRRRIRERIYEWLCVKKDEKEQTKDHLSPSSCAFPTQAPSVSHTTAPNSYTNPAYFIFEGMPVLQRVEEIPSPCKESQVVWAKDTVIQLPVVTGGNSNGKMSTRRPDFTEIEIPGSLAPYKPFCESPRELPLPASSYQLFPGPDVPNISPNQRHRTSLNQSFQLQSHKNNMTQDSVLPVKKLTNSSYMNHSIFSRDIQMPLKEKVRKDYHHEGRPMPMRNGPKLYPYMSTGDPIDETSAPWVVEQTNAASGDNSLTALQIAKSLSEVDFQPVDRKYQFRKISSQHRYHGYDYGLANERNYCWEKEVSVLHGAPETVRELLSTLGLQRYTLDLSRNGWDDLDYFRGITEEELCAAGVSNPSHRRRILENLPKIWD